MHKNVQLFVIYGTFERVHFLSTLVDCINTKQIKKLEIQIQQILTQRSCIFFFFGRQVKVVLMHCWEVQTVLVKQEGSRWNALLESLLISNGIMKCIIFLSGSSVYRILKLMGVVQDPFPEFYEVQDKIIFIFTILSWSFIYNLKIEALRKVINKKKRLTYVINNVFGANYKTNVLNSFYFVTFKKA